MNSNHGPSSLYAKDTSWYVSRIVTKLFLGASRIFLGTWACNSTKGQKSSPKKGYKLLTHNQRCFP